jgi:predicted enzyme related to lactoylglutathione lyase
MLKHATIHVYLPAAKISRARTFYEEVLGLTPKEVYAGGVFYECGGAVAFLYPTPNAGTSKASQAYWEVADVEAEVADLKARGHRGAQRPNVQVSRANAPGCFMPPPSLIR